MWVYRWAPTADTPQHPALKCVGHSPRGAGTYDDRYQKFVSTSSENLQDADNGGCVSPLRALWSTILCDIISEYKDRGYSNGLLPSETRMDPLIQMVSSICLDVTECGLTHRDPQTLWSHTHKPRDLAMNVPYGLRAQSNHCAQRLSLSPRAAQQLLRLKMGASDLPSRALNRSALLSRFRRKSVIRRRMPSCAFPTDSELAQLRFLLRVLEFGAYTALWSVAGYTCRLLAVVFCYSV